MYYILPDPRTFPDLILAFDVASNGEKVKFPAVVTEHPVERGSTIADHLIEGPIEIELIGFVTQTPTKRNKFTKRGENLLNQIRVPGIRTITGAKASTNPITGETTVTQEFVDSGARVLSVETLSFPERFNAVREMALALLRVRRSKTFVAVTTEDLRYDNLLISDFDYEKVEGGADFTVMLKQVTVVTNQRVEAPEPAEPRGQPTQPKGDKQPEEVDAVPDDPKERVGVLLKLKREVFGR